MSARFDRLWTARVVMFSLLFSLSASLAARAQQSGPEKSSSATQTQVPDKDKKKDETKYPTAHLKRTPEDFGAITLETSQLQALPPTLGDTFRKENFTEEFLQVQWRELDPIDLYVVKPIGVEKPPVVIYLYGYPSDVKVFSNEGWLNRATRGGYAAVGFAGALTDYRFRMRPLNQTFFTQLDEALATTTHDVQMLLNYLESRGDLDMSRVGLYGAGSGATVAILAAAADPRIKAIECFEPWGDWPKWLATSNQIPIGERADYLKPEFLAKAAPMDPVKWLPTLTKQQVQIQFIDTDDSLAKEARIGIEGAAPKTAEILHFADRGQHMGAVANGRMFDWLKSQLQPPLITPQPQQASASVQNKEKK